MNKFLDRLSKLINVKSIMTISLTIGFLVLTLGGLVSAEQFLMVYSTIVAFYFSTQANKKE